MFTRVEYRVGNCERVYCLLGGIRLSRIPRLFHSANDYEGCITLQQSECLVIRGSLVDVIDNDDVQRNAFDLHEFQAELTLQRCEDVWRSTDGIRRTWRNQLAIGRS